MISTLKFLFGGFSLVSLLALYFLGWGLTDMTGLFGFITWEVFWNQGVLPAGFLLAMIAIYAISDKCLDWTWLRLLELNVYLKKRLKR